MDQSVKVRLHPGERRNVKTGSRVGEGSCFFTNSITLVQQTFGQGCSGRFGDFRIGGQVIRTVQNADDHVLLAKEATEIQDVINRLIERNNMFGMGRNVKVIKVVIISRQPSRVQIMTKNYLQFANIVNELEVLRLFTFKT